MGTRLNNSHETLIWATKSKNSKFVFNYKTAKELNRDTVSDDEYLRGVRKQMGSVWKFAVCSGSERLKDSNGEKLHSTQKPLEMLERIIAISTNPGDLVLDPFGGTMTTAAAAIKFGRNYLTIERETRYCEYGQKRLEHIKPIDSPIANAAYDIKPVKVTLQQLIADQVLHVGEWFSFRNGKPVARLVASGKLFYNDREMDIHSVAALARGVKAKRLNGFDYWYVKRGATLVSISELREEYRKKIAPSEVQLFQKSTKEKNGVQPLLGYIY